MPALTSPYSALLYHASRFAGEEPWLFHSEGLDWRWHSWGEVARLAAGWAGHFAGRPSGSRVPFPYRPGLESIALDLGIMGAGLVSAPSFPGGPRERLEEEGRGDEGLGREAGAVVAIDGSPVELGFAELMAMAERVQAEIAPARRAGEREIVVLGGALETPEERAMLTWATVTGAAVALEPAHELRMATAAWVRPTVFHGTVEEIAALRARAEKTKRRRGLPFGRLRTLLVAGGEKLRDEDAAFWQEHGVRLGRVPSLAAERHNHGI